MSKPFYKIHIEITDFCGLSCHFCSPRKNHRGVMSLELFERSLLECAPHTDLIALHLLGDPLTLPSLPSYLDALERHSLRAEVTTSGFFLGERERSALAHPAIKQVNLSLTSYFSNAKRLGLAEYWSHILALLKERENRGSPEYLNLRLWNLHSEPRQEELFQRIESHFGCKLDLSKKRQRLAPKLILDLDELFEWPNPQAPAQTQGYCLALQTHLGILSDGTIVPCCLDALGELALGKIQEGSLDEALHSPRATKIKEGFLAGRRIEPFCQRCGYVKRFDKENGL